jgi:hypothetical protein
VLTVDARTGQLHFSEHLCTDRHLQTDYRACVTGEYALKFLKLTKWSSVPEALFMMCLMVLTPAYDHICTMLYGVRIQLSHG